MGLFFFLFAYYLKPLHQQMHGNEFKLSKGLPFIRCREPSLF